MRTREVALKLVTAGLGILEHCRSGKFNQTPLKENYLTCAVFLCSFPGNKWRKYLKEAKLHFTADRSQCDSRPEQRMSGDTFRH